MEEYVKDLLEIVNKEKLCEIELSYLDKYFNIVESYNSLKIENINRDYNDFFEDFCIEYKISIFDALYTSGMKKILEKLIAAICYVEEIEKKEKLIPLIIYLDKNNILYEYLLKNSFAGNLKKYFMEIGQSFKAMFSKRIDVSDLNWEVEAQKRYIDGLKNNNIKDIYSFVDAFERGCGNLQNSFIDFTIFMLAKTSFEDLIKILDNKNDTIGMIYLLNNLSIEEELQIAVKSNNILLKFEVLREVVYFQKKITISTDENNLIQNIIVAFSKDKNIWEQFLSFYLEYPSRAPLLFSSFGKVFSKLEKIKIDDFINHIKLDQHLNQENKESFKIFFYNIDNDKVKETLLLEILDKWMNYVDNYTKNLLSIILTDIFDVIVIVINDFIAKDDIIIRIENSINNLNEIGNIWFNDEFEQRTYFYKEMSKLFLYSFAIKKHKLTSYKKLIQELCKNNIELKYEHKNPNNKTTLQLFGEYINIETGSL